MADIFLSYAREDIECAGSLAQALTAQGWKVFWDCHIPPGRTFEDYIEQQIQNCHALVVLWSPAAVKSTWVKIEAAKGRDRGILVPALIGDADIPFGYGHINAADLRAWRAGAQGLEFEEFVSAIESLSPREPRSAASTAATLTPALAPAQREAGAKRTAGDEQRPVLVRFILAFIAFGLMSEPFSLWLARDMYVDPPTFRYVVTPVSMAIQSAGAVALFRLRAVALKIFAAMLVLTVVSGTYTIVVSPAVKVQPEFDEATMLTLYRMSTIGGLALSVVAWVAVLGYLRRLQRRGILR